MTAMVKANGASNGNGHGHALAVSGAVAINGLGEVFRLASALARARGFVPKAYVGQPEAIAAAVLTGIELGIGPMEALRSLHVVDGKPCMAADFMLARAIRAGVRPQWLRSDAKEARIRLTRAGFEPMELAFTIEEAKGAKLTNKDNWQRYPAAMLRARCVSAAMRAFCPDVLGSGIYTPEEMGAIVDEGGEPYVVVSAPEAPPAGALSADTSDAEDEAACGGSCGNIAPERETSAPVQLRECKTAEDLRAWCRERWPTVLADHGPGAAARVVQHGEAIGVDVADVDRWLGEATPEAAE